MTLEQLADVITVSGPVFILGYGAFRYHYRELWGMDKKQLFKRAKDLILIELGGDLSLSQKLEKHVVEYFYKSIKEN